MRKAADRRRRRPTKPPVSGADGLVDRVSPPLQQARKLWAEGDYDRALHAFELAITDEPNNVRPLVDAARAYAAQFAFERTESILSRLRAVAPNSPGTHHLAGDTYLRLKMLPEALACYRQAAACPNALPVTWTELASLHERANQLSHAREMLARAFSVDRSFPLACFVDAQLDRRAGQLALAASKLHDLLPRLNSDGELACRCWAEIASIRDSEGDYDEAIKATQQWKTVHQARGATHHAESRRIIAHYQQLIQDVDESDFARWRDSVGAEKRVALLTGFPRSGTTLLEQILDADARIVSSEERDYLAKGLFPQLQREHARAVGAKGTPPLIDVLARLSATRTQEARRRYCEVMEWMLGEPIGDRLHIDKNPAYTMTIPVMLRVFPEAKLIIALRDPRDVVVSCYLTYLPANPISIGFGSFQETAERYAVDMNAWSELRRKLPHQWTTIRYEDMVTNTADTARDCVEWLGLEWDDAILNYRETNIAKRVNSPTYAAVAQPIHRRALSRWRNYAKHMEGARECLAPLCSQLGYEP